MIRTQSSMPILTRLVWMLVSWGAIGVVYSISGQQGAHTAHVLTPTAIDRWFTFDPSAIWVYMSFFLFVPLGFFCTPPQRVKWLGRAMVISALGAGIVFYLFPTTMVFPPVTQTGPSAEALKLLMHYDAVVNCLPSLHVTLTCLVLVALWRAGHLWRNLFLTGWALAILVSILQLYRHQFVDLLAGLALASVAGLLALWLSRKGGAL